MEELKPFLYKDSSNSSRNGFPDIGAIGFGRLGINELNLLPKPPARMIASTSSSLF